MTLTIDDKAKLQRLRDDFEYFARNCLFVRTKSGAIEPFRMNQAQRFLHNRIEDQLRRTGRVRGIIVKGRQLGASTYIQGRFYWRLWGGKGLKAFILTHEQDATDNLFGMAQRFHENIPLFVRPPTKAANAKELAFSDNDCSYNVATAGTKGVGRSNTLQLFHGSEVAFWPNAETHIDGVFQAIADVDGTERLLESSANGIGNVFQRRYVAAARGDSDEDAIFIPWFWGEDYRRASPAGWEAPQTPIAKDTGAKSQGWTEYALEHVLTPEQLYWGFCKNRDMATALGLGDDEPCWKFRQEYPATADEAFQTGGGRSFIASALVSIARKKRVVGVGPLIIGVDPARGGGDKTGVIDRRGREMGGVVCERWDDSDLMTTAGRVVGLIRRHNPAAVNIDVGGLGAGVYDRLVEMGFGSIVHAINFGAGPLGIGPTGDELYANRRAEMWDLLRSWFSEVAGVSIPDDDIIHADLTAPQWGSGMTRHSSNNELTLEPKDNIRKRLGFSPDLGDAAALTFAVPVGDVYHDDDDRQHQARRGSTGY